MLHVIAWVSEGLNEIHDSPHVDTTLLQGVKTVHKTSKCWKLFVISFIYIKKKLNFEFLWMHCTVLDCMYFLFFVPLLPFTNQDHWHFAVFVSLTHEWNRCWTVFLLHMKMKGLRGSLSGGCKSSRLKIHVIGRGWCCTRNRISLLNI
jgi:hypothetical protein